MRIALPLALLMFVSGMAHAQTPQVDRIDVVEYGIYTTDTERSDAAPGTATGTVRELTNIRHAETTTTVPAQLGVRFGFRFTVVGAPAGAVVPLHYITIFPPPGMRNPATQVIKTQSEYDSSAAIGVTSYKDYGLDNDWEIVPGVWTFQVRCEGRLLAEQKFSVVKQ
jgi:hypothetical protein